MEYYTDEVEKLVRDYVAEHATKYHGMRRDEMAEIMAIKELAEPENWDMGDEDSWQRDC